MKHFTKMKIEKLDEKMLIRYFKLYIALIYRIAIQKQVI